MIAKLKDKLQRPMSLASFGLWFAILGASAGILYGVTLGEVVTGMWRQIILLLVVVVTVVGGYVIAQARVKVLPENLKDRNRRIIYAAAGTEALTIAKFLELQASLDEQAGHPELAASLRDRAAAVRKRVTKHEEKAYPR